MLAGLRSCYTGRLDQAAARVSGGVYTDSARQQNAFENSKVHDIVLQRLAGRIVVCSRAATRGFGFSGTPKPSSTIPHTAKRSIALTLMIRTLLVCVQIVCTPSIATARTDEPTTERIASLNAAFLEHVRVLEPGNAIAVASILQGWEQVYRDEMPEAFVPDALGLLYPSYRDAMAAFDEQRFADAVRLLERLETQEDPFLNANAFYFRVRALAALGYYEQVVSLLARIDERAQDLTDHTPYAPHCWFIKAFCEARNLRYDECLQTLEMLERAFSHPPEPIAAGARQLRLEIERRESGTLGEVADVMDFVADRLGASDGSPPVRERQEQIVNLLDRLIQQMEQQEQQSGGGQQARRSQAPRQSPREAKRTSDAPEGAGEIGELRAAPPARPGEMWGKLPVLERERILQSLRQRFPSRYRQLVEQYYRSLAEEEK